MSYSDRRLLPLHCGALAEWALTSAATVATYTLPRNCKVAGIYGAISTGVTVTNAIISVMDSGSSITYGTITLAIASAAATTGALYPAVIASGQQLQFEADGVINLDVTTTATAGGFTGVLMVLADNAQ